MKIHNSPAIRGLFLAVLTVTGWLGAATDGDNRKKNETTLITSDGGLRGGIVTATPASAKLLKLKQVAEKDQVIMASLPAIHEMGLHERVDLMKKLNSVVDETMVALADMKPADLGLDLDDFNTGQAIQNVFTQFIGAVESSKTSRDKAIGFVEQAAISKEGPRNNTVSQELLQDSQSSFTNDEYDGHSRSQSRHGRRTKESDKTKHQNDWANFGSSNNENFHQGFGFQGIRDLFGGSTDAFHSMMHKRKSFAASMLGRSVVRSSDVAHRDRGRGRRNLAEIEQKHHVCVQLAECAASMSQYDFFVYFKLDDIDGTTGEVDTNRIEFDEGDLVSKYQRVREQANTILGHAAGAQGVEGSYCRMGSAHTPSKGHKHYCCISNTNCVLEAKGRQCSTPTDVQCEIPSEVALCDNGRLGTQIIDNERRHFCCDGAACPHDKSIFQAECEYASQTNCVAFMVIPSSTDEESRRLQETGPLSQQPSSFPPSESPSGSLGGSESESPSDSPSGSSSGGSGGSSSFAPTSIQSESPIGSPFGSPSRFPSSSPSNRPSGSPSNKPSAFPSDSPSFEPSQTPSSSPTQSPTIEMNVDLSGLCNNLLMEFHRTVENDVVPKWEGGTVGQVCMAEGTMAYVKLGDAAFASRTPELQAFRDKASSTNEKHKNGQVDSQTAIGLLSSSFVTLTNAIGDAVAMYAREPLQCAAELFFEGDVRHSSLVQKISAGDAGDSIAYEDPSDFDHIAIASDGMKFGLDGTGRLLADYGAGWDGPFDTPFEDFVHLDVALGLKQIVVDADGKLHKRHGSGLEFKAGGHLYSGVLSVSVGRDGTAWALSGRELGTWSNHLCVLDGSEWNCYNYFDNFFQRNCHHNFQSVHVGDKDNIYLLTTKGEILHFRGWKSGQVGVAECVDHIHLTYRPVKAPPELLRPKVYYNGEPMEPGKTTALTVAVDEDGLEQAVYISRRMAVKAVYPSNGKDYLEYSDVIYVLDQSSARYHENGWRRLSDLKHSLPGVGYTSISTSGNGNPFWAGNQFWATNTEGEICQWTGKTYDTVDWSSTTFVSTAENRFDCFRDNDWAGAGAMSASVASNGDLCYLLSQEEDRQVMCKTATPKGYTKGTSVTSKGIDGVVAFMDVGYSGDEIYIANANGSFGRGPMPAFRPLEFGPPTRFRHASVTDDGWIWAVAATGSGVTPGTVWRKEFDGSDEFTQITSAASSLTFESVSAVSKSEAWNLDSAGDVYHLIDDSWNLVGSPDGVMWVKLSAAADGTVMAISQDGHLYRVDNNQTNWVQVTSFGAVLDISVGGSDRIAAISKLQWRNEKFVFGKKGLDPRAVGMINYRIPYAVDTSDTTSSRARNEHGQLISNEHVSAGFLFKTYNELVYDYKKCAGKLVTEFSDELGKEWLSKADLDSKLDEFEEDLQTKCTGETFANIVDAGLGLVFGDKPSPGFVCGMKEAIINRDHSMPGYCCLDAPYELEGDAWGHPYDCDTAKSCKRMGPYFAGMSTMACDAHGGTWCPQRTDCSTLRNCIEEDINTFGKKHPAHKSYLQNAPTIADVHDSTQCGRTRTYFGFDAHFLNDQAICDDINELRFSKDFSFFDEFFGAESGDGGRVPKNPGKIYKGVEVEPIEVEPITVEDIEIDDIEVRDIFTEGITVKGIEVDAITFDKYMADSKPIFGGMKLADPADYKFDLGEIAFLKSSDAKAAAGAGWRAANFALETAVDVQAEIAKALETVKCPGDFTGAVQTACAVALNVAIPVLRAVVGRLKLVSRISTMSYNSAMVMQNNDPYVIYDRVVAMETQLRTTGTYLENQFAEVQGLARESFTILQSALENHNKQVKVSMQTHHNIVGQGLKQHHQNIGKALYDHHSNIGEALVDHHQKISDTLVDHNAAIGDALEEHHSKIADGLEEHNAVIGDALETHHENIGNALEEHHEQIGDAINGINDSIKNGATSDEVEALHHDVRRLREFGLQVEILHNSPTSKQVIVMTTFQGDLMDFDLLSIEEVSGSTIGSLSYTKLGGKAGAAILDLQDATASVFVFHASYTHDITGKKHKQSQLVSFGVGFTCDS